MTDWPEACLILGQEGQEHFMLGDVRARAPETDGYWVKPARFGLAEVTSEILVMVDLDGHRLKGYGALHGELPI